VKIANPLSERFGVQIKKTRALQRAIAATLLFFSHFLSEHRFANNSPKIYN
jgi:hypothetical protein